MFIYIYIYRSRSIIIYHGDFYFHVWVPRDDQEKMDYVVRAAEDTALPWRAWECHFNRRRWVVYHGLYQGLSSFPWISMAVVYGTPHLQTHPNHLKLVANGCDSIRTPFISPLLLFKLSMFFCWPTNNSSLKVSVFLRIGRSFFLAQDNWFWGSTLLCFKYSHGNWPRYLLDLVFQKVILGCSKAIWHYQAALSFA